MTDDGIDEGLKEKWIEVLNPYNNELINQQIRDACQNISISSVVEIEM